MCPNICFTLVNDPPAQSVAKLRRKFPAGISVPATFGWLYHLWTQPHLLLVHVVLTVIIVPICFVTIRGLSALHKKQNWNNISSFDKKKTMYFGSVLSSSPAAFKLDLKYKEINTYKKKLVNYVWLEMAALLWWTKNLRVHTSSPRRVVVYLIGRHLKQQERKIIMNRFQALDNISNCHTLQ